MILEVKVPMVGESITEVIMGEWKKVDGDYVEMDEAICTIESDKAAMDIVAEKSGKLQIIANTGDTLKIGDLIARIDTSVQKKEKKEDKPIIETPDEIQKSPKPSPHDKIFITPMAKKLLAEAEISPTEVKGSGPIGKITKSDAYQAITEKEREMEKESIEQKLPSEEQEKNKKEEPSRKEIRQTMTTLRRTIANHLVSAKNETAMLTTINEIDMSTVLKMRQEFKEEFLEKHGVKLGFMSFFSRAVCLALKEIPVVNARVDGNDIVFHQFVDLSIAVSTPRGLVVPVIRNAHQMQMGELEKQIQEMAIKARDGKLTIQEMSGGTFTITNGGVFGSLISTPIINTPQSAVLGMHVIQERPVASNGQVVIRPMMYISLSYDHRIIDGRESVLFLIHLKKLMENPHRMFLEL